MYQRKERKKIVFIISILVLICAAGIGGFLLYHHISMNKTAVTASVSENNVDAADLQDAENEPGDSEPANGSGMEDNVSANDESGAEGSMSANNGSGAEGNGPAAESGTATETGDGELADNSGAEGDRPSAESETETDKTARSEPVKVRGIYVTGPMAGSASMENLIKLIDETELNTMVIDVKNDEGQITYQMDLDIAQNMDACISYIGDMESLMATLKEHDIYTIARIVCFKDPYLAQNYPELALKKADGTPVTDAYGLAWVNPCKEGVWEYLTDVAIAAANAGFDEIQYDYVRFPIGSDADAADYGVAMESGTKEKMITGFLAYASKRLHEKGIVVTADVFGTIIGNEVDIERVGQNYVTLAETIDVLSPMVYPSHYGSGVYGYSVPDAEPYGTVLAALTDSSEELQALKESDRAIVRPWLQAFTATWVDGHISYGGKQIREQIQAVYDAGYDEWILWNSRNHYEADGLLSADEADVDDAADADNIAESPDT